MRNLRNSIQTAAALTAVLSSATAYSAGFEKAVMWSARYGGVAGAASAIVSGPESLYFNPAGLAGSATAASVNFSPTFSTFKGPVTASNTEEKSSGRFSPIPALQATYKLNDKLSVGAGYFLSGGSNVVYESVNFSGVNANFQDVKPNVKSKLGVHEVAVGAGYEVMDGLRVGAAWRAVFISAELGTSALGAGSSTLSGVELNELSDSKFGGFRAGMQYAPRDAGWGVGVNFRSAIDFRAKGKFSGRLEVGATGTQTDLTSGGEPEAAATFPLQISIGTFFDMMGKKLRILPEYTFTRYGVNRVLDLNGTFTIPPGIVGPSAVTASLADLTLNWRNQHNARLGLEYAMSSDMALRAGYIATSQVVPSNFARATFSSPGIGHSIFLGSGLKMASNLGVDAAVEYSTASGDGEASALLGSYSSSVFAAHVGATYAF